MGNREPHPEPARQLGGHGGAGRVGAPRGAAQHARVLARGLPGCQILGVRRAIRGGDHHRARRFANDVCRRRCSERRRSAAPARAPTTTNAVSTVAAAATSSGPGAPRATTGVAARSSMSRVRRHQEAGELLIRERPDLPYCRTEGVRRIPRRSCERHQRAAAPGPRGEQDTIVAGAPNAKTAAQNTTCCDSSVTPRKLASCTAAESPLVPRWSTWSLLRRARFLLCATGSGEHVSRAFGSRSAVVTSPSPAIRAAIRTRRPRRAGRRRSRWPRARASRRPPAGGRRAPAG